MEKVNIKPEFLLTESEISEYNNLPDNLPDNKLTKEQIDFINSLYYKYIEMQIDNQKWGLSMYENEKKEKWPSGPRMKSHEAKRIVLSNLVEQVMYNKEIDLVKAVQKFHGALTCRPMYAKLLHEVYDVRKQ